MMQNGTNHGRMESSAITIWMNQNLFSLFLDAEIWLWNLWGYYVPAYIKHDTRWMQDGWYTSVYNKIPWKSSGLGCDCEICSQRGCSGPPAMERLHKFRSWRKLPRQAETVHATALEGDEFTGKFMPVGDQCLGFEMIHIYTYLQI